MEAEMQQPMEVEPAVVEAVMQQPQLEVPEAVPVFRSGRLLLQARVREAPSDAAATLRFERAGTVLRGSCIDGMAGKWLELAPGPGFVRCAYEDGERILADLDPGGTAAAVVAPL